MIDAVFDKLLTIILVGLVETDYVGHSKVAEHFQIIFRGIAMLGFPRHLLRVVYGTHKRDELPWNNPVQITIFYLLVVLIFPGVKLLEAVPSELIRDFQTLQAVINLYLTFIASIPLPCIRRCSHHRTRRGRGLSGCDKAGNTDPKQFLRSS